VATITHRLSLAMTWAGKRVVHGFNGESTAYQFDRVLARDDALALRALAEEKGKSGISLYIDPKTSNTGGDFAEVFRAWPPKLHTRFDVGVVLQHGELLGISRLCVLTHPERWPVQQAWPKKRWTVQR
jgi:hypothetical protein